MRRSSAAKPLEGDELRQTLKDQIRHPYITGQGIRAREPDPAPEKADAEGADAGRGAACES